LLRRVQGQDQQAWKRLVDLYTPLVYGWCRRKGLQQADASDVGEDVFMSVFQSIANFRRDRPGDSFRAWLCRITQNKLNDYFDKRRREPPGTGGDQAQKFVEQIPVEPETDDVGEESELVRGALKLIRGEFEEKSVQAFIRVSLENQRPKDVAHDLGMTVNAVYVAKGRILRRLREEYDGLIKFPPG
jgi:RNA polymerase sigma-70 factor (ECF subfamily)